MSTQQDGNQKKRHLGRTFLLVWCIAMGASILGAMAGGGITAEMLITKAITYAIAGGIVVGIIAAFRALK